MHKHLITTLLLFLLNNITASPAARPYPTTPTSPSPLRTIQAFKCPSDGYFPDKYNCDTYYDCSRKNADGIATVCPRGLEYDADSAEDPPCSFASPGRCKAVDLPSTPNYEGASGNTGGVVDEFESVGGAGGGRSGGLLGGLVGGLLGGKGAGNLKSARRLEDLAEPVKK